MMMNDSQGYIAPQVQRKFLIPLAEAFIAVAEDPSSLQEFINFVITDRKTTCTKDNVRNWRKDALKALRLVSAREMMVEEVPEVSTDQKRPPGGSDAMDTEPSAPVPKKLRLSSVLKIDISCCIPTLKIDDIVNTVPPALLKQVQLAFKCHLKPSNLPDVWPTVLINGPPFCGKTTLIKAIAGTLQVNYLSVTVGLVTPTIRTWREIFNQAKINAPCILHIDAIDSMEKQNVPVGTFRVVCLLKNELLIECVGTGIVVVGETRRLIASLPQDVTDLFTHRFTFGMMEESCRLSLLSQFLVDEVSSLEEGDRPSMKEGSQLVLAEDLTLGEIAHRTPGYEAGDLIRLVRGRSINIG
ncbi:VCP-like ATPase [Echinococcus granulosus]|uniref:VCP-like ATPase n=1 Tax=Echinococcus granulosus TaxID=6210 RepID=W6UDB7_ECHGR|nr:VCP-like ATPase [Echinococcus granulosus]EUB56317.1 VCP-like ATPase [Echinococcus granulosus]